MYKDNGTGCNDMTEKPLPEVLSTEVVAHSNIFQIERLHLRFHNGEERHFERFRPRNKGAVMILPFLNDETFLMIREYAAGLHHYELSLPKGAIDAGEDPVVSANRELMEEVGYGAHDIQALKPLSMAPGHGRASMHTFVAKDLYAKRLPGDEPEPLDVIEMPFNQIDEIIQRPDVTDARTVATLLYYRALYKKGL